MKNWIDTNGDILVSIDGGQTIDVNVDAGSMGEFGDTAFSIGIGEGASVTIDGDYRKLRNLPTINGITVIGDLSLEDLSLRAVYYDSTANFDALGKVISQKGALYIYSDYMDYVDDDGTRIVIPGIRVGDGKTPLQDLQFSGGSSGSGGTTNYNALRNKPAINGVTLQGNIGLEDLSLKAVFYATKDAWDAMDTHIPSEGDLYIYSDYTPHTDENGVTTYSPAIKIGDGVTELSALSAIVSYNADDAKEKIVTYLRDENLLVTAEDRRNWNQRKLRVEVDPTDNECLRFYYI